MPKLVLFGNRLSPFVEKVARALGRKRLRFELAGVRSPADFKKWNPTARKMPVLEVDGERVFDSTFILRRLDELAPEPELFDRDPKIAAAQRLLEDWSDEALYWQVMALRWVPQHADASARQIAASAPAFLRPLAVPMIKRKIGRSPQAQGAGRLPYDVQLREIARSLDDLVTLLGDRPFFYAQEPSAADFAIYGEFNSACSGPTPEFERMLAERPTLLDFRKRVEEAAPLPAAA
jgi:glutathione S-transferase